MPVWLWDTAAVIGFLETGVFLLHVIAIIALVWWLRRPLDPEQERTWRKIECALSQEGRKEGPVHFD